MQTAAFRSVDGHSSASYHEAFESASGRFRRRYRFPHSNGALASRNLLRLLTPDS